MFRLLQEIRFRRNGVIGWGLGISFIPFLYISIYPEFVDQMGAFQEMMDLAIYQAMGISMADFESYVASTVINIAPLLVGVYAIINSTATLAGEEDDGRLELIVTLPVPRWQIVITKAIATGIALLLVLGIVGGASAATLYYVSGLVKTTASALDVFLSLIAAWPLVTATAMIGLFFAAFAPSRRIAALLTTVVFLISYFGNNLSGLIQNLDSVQFIFPHAYFDATSEVLLSGPNGNDMLILLAIAFAFLLLALVFFQWRNLTVGAWPWQRGKLPARS